MSFIYMIVVFAITGFLLFLFMPIKSKKVRYIFFGAFLLSLLLVAIIPGGWLCGIKLPIVNKSANALVDDFISKNEHLSNAVAFSPELKDNILFFVHGIVRGVVLCVFFALALLICNFVFYIRELVHKSKFGLFTISFVIIIAVSGVFLFSSACTVGSVYATLNQTTAKKGEKFYETYEGFDEYRPIITILDGFNDKVKPTKGIGKIFAEIGGVFSFGYIDMFKQELYNVDPYLKRLKDTGVTIIYTNDSFYFRNTQQDTFDFEEIKKLVNDVLKSRIYADMARSFANDILVYLEKQVAQDSGRSVEDVHLQFSKDEFKSQYKDILYLLEFVVKYNLMSYVQAINDDLGNLMDVAMNLVNDHGLSAVDVCDELLSVSKYPIIQKIQSYMNFPGYTGDNILLQTFIGPYEEAAIYTCKRLYDVLDGWLDDYRNCVNHTMYSSSKTFLQNRGIIS